jgi:phosphoheptose isomerase
MSRRYALLDRDGTLIVEKHHLSSIDELELLPGAAEGLRRLATAGVGAVVVTNQSVVGRGMLSMEELKRIHDEMLRRLGAEGAGLEGIYICPHRPDENCTCRKPSPELAQRAAAELRFELREAFVIGDQPGDIQMGRACGATTLLVRTGYGGQWEQDGLQADFVADDLAAAAGRIQAMLSLTGDAETRLRRHIETSIETKRKLLESGVGRMLEAAGVMRECLAGGNKLLLCGNGGSAGDAQHIAAEFVSVLNQSFLRPGLAAIALTTDTSVLTASANDFGFAGVFERQVQALGRPGDVVIGISTSGNSENVLRAVNYARSHGMRTIALTGDRKCKLAEAAEIALRAPSAITQFIQESHIMIGHILCDLVEQSLTYNEHGPNR